MRLKGKSIEELEEIEQKLLESEDTGNRDGYYYKLIDLYSEMYNVIRSRTKKDPEDNIDYLNYTLNKLVTNLIHYGTFLKMERVKSEYAAERMLEKALKYDKTNPICHYRLGFLAYKNASYNKAFTHFESAIKYQNSDKNNKWKLTDQQLYRAHLFLSNSALYIAAETNENMKQLPYADQELIPNYEMSPLYTILENNETYLHANAFIKIGNECTEFCSKDECDELYEEKTPENCIVLYFADHEYCLAYNNKRRVMNPSYARLLSTFLLNSSMMESLTIHDVLDHFQSTEIRINTYIQKIRRLRGLLSQFDIPDIIETDQSRNETAYFYNHAVPFLIMQRVEEYTD